MLVLRFVSCLFRIDVHASLRLFGRISLSLWQCYSVNASQYSFYLSLAVMNESEAGVLREIFFRV